MTASARLLGNHQRCWIWGRHLVETTLAAGRWRILELLAADQLAPDRLDALRSASARADVPLAVVPGSRIDRLCRQADHQGLAARMPPYPYADPQAVLAAPGSAHCGPMVILDGIQDAFNFGAILRSCDVFGVSGVWIAERGQVGVTSMVARASAGAVNHLPVYRVPDLIATVDTLRRTGIRIVGASEKAATDPRAIDWRQPTALILGNEGHGIRAALRERCDDGVGIPQRPGAVSSLNVAAAAAVLLYAAALVRQPPA